MAFYYIVAAIFVMCTLVVWMLKERALYVLFLSTYTHSFVIPYLYTHGLIDKDLARGLFVVKDLLLLELFAWCGVALFTRFQAPWSRPLKALLLLTVYCGLRVLVGSVFLDDEWSKGLLRMKLICFPIEIIVVVMVFAALNPEFGRRFLRNITYLLSVLAVVALVIFFGAPRDFWVTHANIAEYNADVKGDTENDQDFGMGLSGSGLMGAGRAEAFADIAAFRAIGTFGDGLTLSFEMAAPVLLLFFYFSRNFWTNLMLAACTAALVFSLSRSGWIFCASVATFVLVKRRHFVPFLILGGLVVGLVLLWAPMTQFAVATVFNATTSSDNDDSAHVEGLRWFYTKGFSDPGNILGKGMGPEAQSIPESGYAYLLEHFGLLAYISFVWFCFAMYRRFGRVEFRRDKLLTVAQGIPVGILVVMHFSQYPFSFTAFITWWYVVGLCLSRDLLPKPSPVMQLQPVAHLA